MKRLLRKILFGITLQQEYLCVRANEFVKALKVIAYDNSFKHKVDITSNLLFVGYKPLTLAVDSRYLNEIKVNRHENLHLSFYTQENKELAKLIVKLINQVNFNSVISLIFEGVKGLHSFSNNFHKLLK